MGDVVKGILIGALVFFTAGLILPAIGLASPFAGLFGIKSALLAATLGGAITGGLAVLLAPSMDLEEVQNRLNLSIDPNALAKWVFGETPAATDIMYTATHGSEDQYVSYIIAAAAHEIEGFTDFYVNEDLVTFDGSFLAQGVWAGGLLMRSKRGLENQTNFADISDGFTPQLWPADAPGAGIAYYQLRWLLEFGKLQDEGGIPSRITHVAQGCQVYDPRLDSTRGGTGLHRADQQSTWEYTNGGNVLGQNWALLIVFYLLGWRKGDGTLLFGVGVDPDDIDWDQVIAAANVCDTLVDGIPKYRINGLFGLSQDHERIIGELESAILGKVAQVGGKYYLWAPHDDLVPFDRIDETDLVREVGVEFMPSGPLEELYNTCRGRFISPAEMYQPVPYAEIKEAAYITEDGRVRSVEHDFACIQDSSIAERIARYKVRRSRFGATWKFAMGAKGLTFRPFTVTTLNIQETNFTDTLVRIVDMTISQQGIVLMTCIEEDSSIYDTTDPLLGAPGQNNPGAPNGRPDTGGRPGSGGAVNLIYDDLDTTGEAQGQGRYALLTDRAVNTSGAQNDFHLTDALLLNRNDTEGARWPGFFQDVNIGDRIQYFISADRWYLFQVDELFTPIGSGASTRWKFGVHIVDYRHKLPTADISTSAGVDVTFQFSNQITEGANLVKDPDFDLSAAIPSKHWDFEVIGNIGGGVTFNSGGGANASNSVTLTRGDGTSGLNYVYLVTKRRIKSADANTFTFVIKYKTTAQVTDYFVAAFSYGSPGDTTEGVQALTRSITLPNTAGVWKVIQLTATYDFENAEPYVEFQTGLWDGAVNQSVDIDSVFVYAQPKLVSYKMGHSQPAISANTLTIDVNVSNSMHVVLNANITSVLLNNPPASGTYTEILIEFVQDATGGRTVGGWPAAVKWHGGSAPVMPSTANTGRMKVSLSTRDGGTTWLGEFADQGYS